jgi:hypothetical protein
MKDHNTKKTHLLTIALATALVLCVNPSARSATIVDFALDANSVNSDTNFLRGGGGDTSWSLTDPISNSTLYANAPTNATFYGGYDTVDESTAYIADDNTNGDYVGFSVLTGSNDDYVGAVMWKKEDFLTGISQQLDIDSSSRFTADIGSINASNDKRRPGYSWMFLEDDTIYVSDVTLFGNTDPNPLSINSGDLTQLSWSSVNLTSNMQDSPQSATPGFMDIQGVGIYFTTAQSDSGDARDSQLYSFKADVTVIPEPSAGALLAGFLLGLLTLRRRR